MGDVQFYLIAVALHKPDLFDVDVMAWDVMKAGLKDNRVDFVADIAGKYHCVVAFLELGCDL